MSKGELSVVKSRKESEWEWKINNFSLSKGYYTSPSFESEGECWWLCLYPNGISDTDDGHMDVSLWRSSFGSPVLEVEFSVSVKTTEGTKSFERRERSCFQGCGFYDIKQWVSICEFSNRQREFLSSECLTILLRMMKAGSGESESASASAASSFSKDCHQGDKVSLDHECQISNAKVGSVAEVCSCCKESRHGECLQKIPVHKKCLDQPIMCPKCAEIVSWQKWFGHECPAANIKTAANISGSSVTCNHGNITQDLEQLLLNQEHSDVILRVKGEEFAAHKGILSARSSVFASTFRHEMMENKTGIVDIEDCDPSAFPDFLRFVYCNDTSNLSGENVFGLFTISDKYDCEELRVKCVRFIKNNLSVEMFCKALALALLHSEAELLRVAIEFFIENAGKILVTVDWQTFAAENPTQSNKLFIKYVNSTTRSNK